jgi:hypothetical protein
MWTKGMIGNVSLKILSSKYNIAKISGQILQIPLKV